MGFRQEKILELLEQSFDGPILKRAIIRTGHMFGECICSTVQSSDGKAQDQRVGIPGRGVDLDK